jgi:hypothetical protein
MLDGYDQASILRGHEVLYDRALAASRGTSKSAAWPLLEVS